MIPDWSAKVEPVPYAKLADPQTLNLYSYGLNNALSGLDADGHATDMLSNIAHNFADLIADHELQKERQEADQNNTQVTAGQHDANAQAQDQAIHLMPGPQQTSTSTSKNSNNNNQEQTEIAQNMPPGMDPAAQAAKAAARGNPKVDPAPTPRSTPGPDPRPPMVAPGEPGPPPPGLTGQTLGWILLQIIKAIGSKGISVPVCISCEMERQRLERQQHPCGTNNPNCAAELLHEEWPNLAKKMNASRRSWPRCFDNEAMHNAGMSEPEIEVALGLGVQRDYSISLANCLFLERDA